MKRIYLTNEDMKEIEAKIAQLEYQTEMVVDENNPNISKSRNNIYLHNLYCGELKVYKKIQSLATILPVEEYWIDIGEKHGTFYQDDAEVLSNHFPQGVIIQHKQ